MMLRRRGLRAEAPRERGGPGGLAAGGARSELRIARWKADASRYHALTGSSVSTVAARGAFLSSPHSPKLSPRATVWTVPSRRVEIVHRPERRM